MKWTGLNEIREQFLSFFESKQHTRLHSYPLVPINDNSLLLINSGMAPMKKFFLGLETPPSKRVTTCQKCIRTPDIENVGKTARHGTYFEMLGNFSFGDYFKVEATAWAWEFITKVMEMPEDKLWITIYEDDDEAFDIWTKQVGIPPERIVRMGKEDNFWEIGSGPCGPCSEIYFDRGVEHGCGSPDCAVGCECDRFIEFWNLVFSQFDSDGEGHYERMAHPNIDTGMGLERLACISQNVDNLFEVDTVQNIMKHICRITGVEYKKDSQKDVSIRVITDHIRSTTMMIGDGVVPENEGRGYVLKRLLRRAARHGRLLGVREPFLYKVARTVIEENKNAYPDLVEKADYICKLIEVEEKRFAKTVDKGMDMLNSIMEKMTAENSVLPGEDAFILHDTFGFPLDLTREILEEKGFTVDEVGFREKMQEQKERARKDRKNSDVISWKDDSVDLSGFDTEFTGYDVMENDANVSAIVKDNAFVSDAMAGDDIVIILDKTPFYSESGGQVGDMGIISCTGGEAHVVDCKKSPIGKILHICRVTKGVIETGSVCHAHVDEDRRNSIMRNHTAAHLLQAALREVLGEHVHQAGSYVDENRLRFDFSHFASMSGDEIEKVEKIVNTHILMATGVMKKEMPIAEAKKLGAMALFGEKYGDVVRVIKVGDFSVEFCGGTHVDNISKLGLFKIISESSVAAGVRRVEATTGLGVLGLLRDAQGIISDTCTALKISNTAELPAKVEQLFDENRQRERTVESLRGEIAGYQMGSIFDRFEESGGIKVLACDMGHATPEELRAMGDRARDKESCSVVVLAGENEGRVSVLVSCGPQAVEKGMNAGKIVREVVAKTGGKGGGRPDTAMGGAADISKVKEALDSVINIVNSMAK